MRKCKNCNCNLQKRHQRKYCSNKCQQELRYKTYIEKWKAGKVTGIQQGITASTSHHIKRYLIEKHNGSCSNCGWNKKHPKTGKSILELDHIDGNSKNNLESNLRLLCPNCHSLTMNYKNFNKGNGRAWRRDHYLKITK